MLRVPKGFERMSKESQTAMLTSNIAQKSAGKTNILARESGDSLEEGYEASTKPVPSIAVSSKLSRKTSETMKAQEMSKK